MYRDSALVILLNACLSFSAYAQLSDTCATSANAFLATLDKDQHALAAWPFDEEKRRKWTYYPNVPQLDIRTEGIPLKAMSETQRVAAHRLIECGLSSQGYQIAAGIKRMDDILGPTHLYAPTTKAVNGPVGYVYFWVTVFGEPGGDKPCASLTAAPPP